MISVLVGAQFGAQVGPLLNNLFISFLNLYFFNYIKEHLNKIKEFFLKVGPLLADKIRFICFNKSPLKMTKKVFNSILKALYFILKALSVLEIFNFCLDFLVT